MATHFTKDPDATKDYVWDWTTWLEGDIISNAEVIADEEITVAGVIVTNTAVIAKLSGGTEGQQHKVVCRITTSTEEIADYTIMLKIEPQ